MADPLQVAAPHGAEDDLHGAGDHGHPPHDPPLTRQGGLQGRKPRERKPIYSDIVS